MSERQDMDMLLRRLGERLGSTVSALLELPQLPEDAKAPLNHLEDLGVRLQSLERVIGGHGKLTPEHLDLGLAMVQLRAERAHALDRGGWTIDGQWFLNHGRETGSANANLFAEHAVFLLRG